MTKLPPLTVLGSVPPAEEMTPEQLDALSGGELLRQEASSFTQVLGSIPPAEEMTPEQQDALSGGELLRQEASSFTQVLGLYSSS